MPIEIVGAKALAINTYGETICLVRKMAPTLPFKPTFMKRIDIAHPRLLFKTMSNVPCD